MNDPFHAVTVVSDAPPQGRKTMKFAFTPESRPLDGYTIKRAIQKGGFGEVYYAVSDAGKEVALKLLQHNLEIELRGVKQCLNLKHPNLVTIFDIRSDADGDQWIVMEYVAGRTLLEILDEHPRGMPVEEVRSWLEMTAAGLDFLHDHGIVHRDLKPANLYEEAGIVKIGDVGLSKFITESRRGAQTQSVGTVYYMAPEVSKGQYGKELDVYSLGVMVYEMLSGKLPFDGDTAGEVLMKHLTEPPDLARIPESFRPVLARALEKDPGKRTHSAGDLYRQFASALRGGASVQPSRVDSQQKLRDEIDAATSRTQIEAAVSEYQKEYRRSTSDAVDRSLGEETDDARRRRRGASGGNHRRSTGGQSESPVRDWFHANWGWLLTIVLVLVVFAPATLFGVLGIALRLGIFAGLLGGLAFAGYHAYLYICALEEKRRAPQPVAAAAPRSSEPAEPIFEQKPQPPRPAYRSTHKSEIKPGAIRAIPFRVRMADLFTSLSLAAVFSAAIAGILMLVADDMLRTPAAATAFGLCTAFASWILLAESKLWEGRKVDGTTRRLRMLCLGALVGLSVGFVQDALYSPMTMYGRRTSETLVSHLGSWELMGQYGPTTAGCMVFFGLLFALRRWWWHAESYRSSRVRISSLLGTFLLALVIPFLVAFPLDWSVVWAMSLSAVVQLSAGWIPPEQRRGRKIDREVQA